MIVLNTNARFRLHAWCLCGAHVARSGNDSDGLRRRRKMMKKEGCPKCGAPWMSFEIREER